EYEGTNTPLIQTGSFLLRRKFVFFFSSRRRHTRWPRDWSSDVCSSDLGSLDLRAQNQNSHWETARQGPGSRWGIPSQRASEGGRSEERRVGKECRSRGVTDD